MKNILKKYKNKDHNYYQDVQQLKNKLKIYWPKCQQGKDESIINR